MIITHILVNLAKRDPVLRTKILDQCKTSALNINLFDNVIKTLVNFEKISQFIDEINYNVITTYVSNMEDCLKLGLPTFYIYSYYFKDYFSNTNIEIQNIFLEMDIDFFAKNYPELLLNNFSKLICYSLKNSRMDIVDKYFEKGLKSFSDSVIQNLFKKFFEEHNVVFTNDFIISVFKNFNNPFDLLENWGISCESIDSISLIIANGYGKKVYPKIKDSFFKEEPLEREEYFKNNYSFLHIPELIEKMKNENNFTNIIIFNSYCPKPYLCFEDFMEIDEYDWEKNKKIINLDKYGSKMINDIENKKYSKNLTFLYQSYGYNQEDSYGFENNFLEMSSLRNFIEKNGHL